MAGRYTFTRMGGQSAGKRKAIGFLDEIMEEGEGDSRIDARESFESLSEKKDRELRSRMDYWIDGGRKDSWFHGWPNDHEVKECFCFRWDENKQHHRLYGFLYHPQPKTNASFQICALAYHDFKNDQSTDRTLLLRLMKLRENPNVKAAIGFVFPDEKKPKGRIQ